MSQENHQYDAFISFASPQLPIARALHSTLKLLGLNAFVAEDKLREIGSPSWIKQIHSALRDSHCFIPIFSPNTLTRQWVLYEMGAADSQQIPKFTTRVQGVSINDIKALPANDVLVYDLFREEQVLDLALAIYQNSKGLEERQKHEHTLRNAIGDNPAFHNLLKLSKTQWIFIAGSRPQTAPYHPDIQIEEKPGISGEAVLRRIANDISTDLLNNGYNLMSCPEVDWVGRVVFEVALEFMSDGHDMSERYRIRGQYPNRSQEKSDQWDEPQKKQIKAWGTEFRQSYLVEGDILLVLGGNAGTQQEVSSAIERGIRVIPIHPLLGHGKTLFEKGNKNGIQFPKGDPIWNHESRQQLLEIIRAI